MPSSLLDRPGWELGETQHLEAPRRRRALYNRVSNIGFWIEGETDHEILEKARYKVDELMLIRRIQLHEIISTDDLEPDTVRLHATDPRPADS